MQIAERRSETSSPAARRPGLAVERKPLPVRPLQGGEEVNENAFLGDVRRTVFRVGRIYVGSGFLRTFPIFQHARDILGNIHTNRTTKGVIIECNLACSVDG